MSKPKEPILPNRGTSGRRDSDEPTDSPTNKDSGDDNAAPDKAPRILKNIKTNKIEDVLSTSTPSENLERLTGTFKWYNPEKKCCYGFIKPDNGGRDIKIYGSTILSCGIQTILPGTTIVCDVETTPRGYLAVSILSLDDSTATQPAPVEPEVRATVTDITDWAPATVKFMDSRKGYGFLLKPGDPEEIFVHQIVVRHFGFIGLHKGQKLLVKYGRGNKGIKTVALKPVKGGYRPAGN